MSNANDCPSCPSCDSTDVRAFHEARGVPVNSVLQLHSREEALGYPVGDIVLGHCAACGFIYNMRFDPALLEYSSRCEETQGFSETFQEWHRALAERLVERHDLRGKELIEIGCGKGEFLALLCELGPNRGLGFDPAYVPERNTSEAKDRMEVVRDFYTEKHADRHADFVVCKMTLEHVPATADFVRTIRRSLGDRRDTVVFFQVPDVERILEDVGFWDVYYEHCSYFSRGSLARLFGRCGFEVRDVRREYDGQYLTLEAVPADGTPAVADGESVESLEHLTALVARFEAGYSEQLRQWSERLAECERQGGRPVIWGSGSKGVAFLTSPGLGGAVQYVVDINPHRQGCFMAVTGQEIVGPEFLREYQPTLVIVMNPIYRQEIVRELDRLGLTPEVVTT